MNMDRLIRAAISEAQVDDTTFDSVYIGAQQLEGVEPGVSEIDRAILVIRELLEQGFIPVTTGYQIPAGVPWEEADVEQIVARIRKEFSHLTKEPMFLDICWFRLPRE